MLQGNVIRQSTQSIEQRTETDTLNLLHGNSAAGLIVNFICFAFIVFWFPDNRHYDLKIIWFIAMNCILAFRLYDFLLWKKSIGLPTYNVTNAKHRFLASVYITAVGLSIYSVVFFNQMNVTEFVVTVTMLCALAGAGSTVLAANKKLVVLYSIILILPITICGLLSSIEYHYILGLLALLFLSVMFFIAKKSSDFIQHSLLIRNERADLLHEKESLLAEMARKNNEILLINSSLEEKVKSRTEDILILSNIDSLTQLYNRNAFIENLNALIKSSSLNRDFIAVLFVDLDGFKAINDTYGHAVGDKVLVSVADRLTRINEHYEHICRWGGDEFLLSVKSDDIDRVKSFSQELIEIISQPIRVGYNLLQVGATIGIALYPEHTESETELIILADTAMYAQKQAQKSNVKVFSQDIKDVLNREAMLKKGLETALENDEFHLVYQPIIQTNNGEVAFCEALLRWNKCGEFISPEEFIPVAEQNGFINNIGTWVLNKACHSAVKWDFSEKVGVAVNVSIAQFVQNNIVNIVEQALATSGLPAERLHIEITESLFADDIENIFDQINQLKLLGIKISIDDFGTGFSSLSLLQSLSADVVKVDRTFTQSIGSGGDAIIEATKYVAGKLGYQVVVEGVETKEQVEQLCLIGVDYLQGYYFCKPMKETVLSTWHKEYQLSSIFSDCIVV